MIRLAKPSLDLLPGYRTLLELGWSPDTVRGAAAAREELARIAEDPAAFVASLDDPDAKGAPIILPDGSQVPRLPGFRRWIFDGTVTGSIGLRWQPGTPALPPHVLGHIGYTVVPWKRGMGHAGQALRLMLAEARGLGLPHVELTTALANTASQRVVAGCGGRLVERFRLGAAYGATEELRWRIEL